MTKERAMAKKTLVFLFALLVLCSVRLSFAEEAVRPFRYLAIGNSITRHGICEYWWNECGMAATSTEKDYVHQVAAYLEGLYPAVETTVLPFSVWETQPRDRSEAYTLLDEALTAQPDLITLQVSENVTRLREFSADYRELIACIREKCPQAKLILVDDFWSARKSDIKRSAARDLHLPFASLRAIRGDAAYQSETGAAVLGADGETHFIGSAAVARHPNDAGMDFIAEAIISQLQRLH